MNKKECDSESPENLVDERGYPVVFKYVVITFPSIVMKGSQGHSN
jgi:hypothetical protein